MPVYKDQLGNNITLDSRPRRIVSIVPSQSEFLWDLGLIEELVGITKFCIHPSQMFRAVERVGGTKKLDMEKIRKLKPDLIIGNKEENERSQVEALQKEFPVWMSDIYTLEDSFAMMQNIAEILDKEQEAAVILSRLKHSLAAVRNSFAGQTLAYFIWNKPYMCAARNTFIDHILNYLGFKNALASLERYPELDEAALKTIAPEICLLSSEPFPFKENHAKELQQILPEAQIIIADGEVFSWYGTRLLHLENYVKTLPFKREADT